jgi:tetratricopeptide (TPR) repeat protein
VVTQLPDVAKELREELEKIRREHGQETGDPGGQPRRGDDAAPGLPRLHRRHNDDEEERAKVLADPKDMLRLYNAISAATGRTVENDYAGAARILEGVLKEDPTNPQARFLLAMCYEKTDRTGDAKVILDGVLKDDPENVRALIAMANILSTERNYEEVVAICKRALAKDEHNTQAYVLIADAHIAANDHAGALPYLQKAVEIQPKLTRNRNNLAACLIGLRRFEAAETELKGILSEHPKFPLAHFNLGLLYEEEGRVADARSAYTKEVELHSNVVAARFNLANLLLRAGDVTGAEDQLRQLLKENPDEPRANLFLARALLARSADPDEALPFVKTGLDKATASEQKALGYFLLADIYSRQGRRADVEEALRNARYYQARIAPVHASSRSR